MTGRANARAFARPCNSDQLGVMCDMPEPGVESQQAAWSMAVVIPVFNHGRTVMGVVNRALKLDLTVIVVDDGSTDDTAERIGEAGKEGSGGRIIALRHVRNQGKASALRTGFAEALRRGFTHAATIDADGQLDAGDIPALAAVSRREPESLVLGARPSRMERCPARCLVGRSFASMAVAVQCGERLPDTQCGLRIYPLKPVSRVRCAAERFAFEAEVITRLSWGGAAVRTVPVSCEYFEASRRVSHFKPWADSLRQAGIHLRLVGRRLACVPSRRVVEHRAVSVGEQLVRRALPATWKEETRWGLPGVMTMCCGVAFGMWQGACWAPTPWPWMAALGALYIAWRLHFIPIAVLAGAGATAWLPLRVPWGLGWAAWFSAGWGALFVVGVAVFWALLGVAMAMGLHRTVMRDATAPGAACAA